MTTDILYRVGDRDLRTHPAADVLPLITGDEFTELVADIAANGLHEPVWLYDDPEHGTVLLDGRNRAAACLAVGVPVATRQYMGTDPIGFAESEGLRTRHLNSGQIAFARLGFRELRETTSAAQRKADAAVDSNRRRGATAGDMHERPEVADRPPPGRDISGKARDRVAGKRTGTSGRAVGRAKRVREQSPELAADVVAGKIALDRADRIIRDREAEQRKVAQAKAEAAAAPIQLTVDIRHGDFREVLADLQGVDAIITDPPYPAEFLYLLDDLAAWADKVLTPDGVLAVLMGQTHLPEVYRRLDGHRPYRWTACYLTGGGGYVSHPRRVQSNWKPLIVYGGGPRFGDVFRSEGTDANAKTLHRWGQDYTAFHSIIERLTAPGQTVVDPFAGSGTTLLAAHALGRHAVGCDLDADAVATARERVA